MSLVRGFSASDFRGAKRFGASGLQRAALRAIDVREGRRIQLTRFDGRKDISTNHTPEELPAALADVLAAGFANVHITMAREEIDVRLSKQGKVLVTRKARAREGVAAGEAAAAGHNRVKELALSEGLHGGAADRLLLVMGIVDRHGGVKPTMRGKFTQINEFLKLLGHGLRDVFSESGMLSGHADRALASERLSRAPEHGTQNLLTILDCGCGASHLTLATAYWLNEIKHISAKVLGIDMNPEVIEKSRERAAKLGCDYLEFRTGKIGELTDVRADIVLALHACDTATDDALAQGVRSGAKLIMAVPCCHKNLNARLKVLDLAPIHHQGILHERLADIVTDTFRALLLKVAGYRAEVIEFISPEHTARNLMIRAVKVRAAGDPAAVREYEAFKAFAGVEPYLEDLVLGRDAGNKACQSLP